MGLPALAGHDRPAGSAVSPAGVGSHGPATEPLLRPVLLESPHGAAAEYGNASAVQPATLALFRQLSCPVSKNRGALDSSWQASAGYTTENWNAPGRQVVSCDTNGTRYVLGPAIVTRGQVPAATVGPVPNGSQWTITLMVNAAAAKVLDRQTAHQYAAYYRGAQAGNQDAAALDSDAVVLHGDVLEAPVIQGRLTTGQLTITGPPPDGWTEAQARAVAALI